MRVRNILITATVRHYSLLTSHEARLALHRAASRVSSKPESEWWTNGKPTAATWYELRKRIASVLLSSPSVIFCENSPSRATSTWSRWPRCRSLGHSASRPRLTKDSWYPGILRTVERVANQRLRAKARQEEHPRNWIRSPSKDEGYARIMIIDIRTWHHWNLLTNLFRYVEVKEKACYVRRYRTLSYIYFYL